MRMESWIAAKSSSDCNNNGIDDRCDIQSGEEDDLNRDGTPDSCQCIADVVPNGAVGFSDLVTLFLLGYL